VRYELGIYIPEDGILFGMPVFSKERIYHLSPYETEENEMDGSWKRKACGNAL
jgi:hypothetical protein